MRREETRSRTGWKRPDRLRTDENDLEKVAIGKPDDTAVETEDVGRS